jgi:molecular chaperone DnaK
MLKQAAEFAEQDRQRAQAAEARNKAESLSYEAERVLEENKAKISETDAADVRAKVGAIRTALSAKESLDLPRLVDDLTRSLHAIAQKLYQDVRPGETTASETGPGPTPAPDESATPGSGPVDAEFKVVDKEPGDGKGQA